VLHSCTIRRNALVGMNAVIMDDAEIGEEAIVAACAFVKAGMKVPPRSLVAGMPAKVVRELSEQEAAWKLEGTHLYQNLTRRCHASMMEVRPLTSIEENRPLLQAADLAPLNVVKRG
jgi:phenylacetic acid degradation protein